MTHVSLTRVEAEARAEQITVESMIIQLDLTDPETETFGSRTEITFRSRGDESFVEFRGRELTAAQLNGDDLDPDRWRGGRIQLSGLRSDNTLLIEGRMAYADDGEGLHRHVDPQDQQTYLYAMSFLDAGPRWFACFDQPDLKAGYELRVAAPAHWLVIGNGPSEMVEPGRWVIRPTGRLASYFVTVVAGPYVSVIDEHAGIRLGFHSRASLAAELKSEADDMIKVTRQSFDYYHELFGIPYPFGEYHQAFVPDFNAGAMENPGCVTLRDGFLYRGRATEADRGRRANVIAHELAHMWFGDLVTMRWWDNLWLNESFAEYLAHRCCTAATAYPLWTEFGILRKDWGLVADQSPSTHPIAGQDASDTQIALQNFDGIAYAKGAAVVKQLAVHLGDAVFVAGLRSYIDRFAFGNATFEDLIETWTAAGAIDLGAWADSWLRTVGPDTIDLTWTRPGQATITRAAPAVDPASRVHAIAVGSVDRTGAVTTLGDQSLGDEALVVTVPAETVLVVPDATDATWAKIRFGPGGWDRLAPVLPKIGDEPVLVVIYNAIRDAVRSADLDPATALNLISSGIPTVRAELIISSVLKFAADQLAGAYCPVAERPSRLGRVRDLAGRLLATAEPGSDRQLTAFRLLVRCHDDGDRLRGWADGRELPDGLRLDPDLHWEVVRRLAVVAPDPRSIDAALDRDRSSAGRVQAARAHAALGTAEAKAAAWERLMYPSNLSAYELYATGEGFFDPAQAELTAPYVARFFTEIGATAEFRSGWSLGEVAVKAYPWSATSEETLELAEQALATELAAPIRRALVDATDQLRRAVTALRTYPGAAA